jgi:hypothetical protein
MTDPTLPFLVIPPPRHSKLRKFEEWDHSLEVLLSSPVSTKLESHRLPWKQRTILSADPEIDTSIIVKLPRPSVDKRRQPNMRDRETRIARMITSPLSPRKPIHTPQSLSTNTDHRRKSEMRDHHKVEAIATLLWERVNAREEIKPVRKLEHPSIVREFRFKPPQFSKGA